MTPHESSFAGDPLHSHDERRDFATADRDTLAQGLRRPGCARVADLFGANVPAMALPGETCRIVATRLAVHGLERLLVVSDARSRRLLGLIARSDLIKPSLDVDDQEHRHERFFNLPLAAARDRFRALTGSSSQDEDL